MPRYGISTTETQYRYYELEAASEAEAREYFENTTQEDMEEFLVCDDYLDEEEIHGIDLLDEKTEAVA